MTESIFSAIGALLFVIGLMVLMLWGVRKFGLVPGLANTPKGSTKRLKIIESKMLDPRNRLILVSVDDKEYVLAANQAGARLIDGPLNEKTGAKKRGTFTDHLGRMDDEDAT